MHIRCTAERNARHVPNSAKFLSDTEYRLPLPAPTTSRNLLPRLATTTLSRLYQHSAGGAYDSPSLSLASSRSSRHPSSRCTLSFPLNLSASSSHKRVMHSALAQSSGSSRVLKKRRTRNGHVPLPEEWGTSGEEDEVDQLVSDNELNEQPPPSQSVGESSSQQMGSQSTTASRTSMTAPTNTGVSPQAAGSTSVSSPSLAKILNPVDIEQISSSVPCSSTSPSAPAKSSRQSRQAKASTPKPEPELQRDPDPEHEPLSAYTCPICFFPPTNATLTPCGHICCGSCLFTAVKTTMQRGVATGEGNIAR